MSLKVHHVGYLVKKLDKATEAFKALGYETESGPVRDEIRKVDISFMIKDGYRVELVSPYAGDSVVADMIKRYTNMPYHICYESDDFAKDAAALRTAAYIPIDKPTVAVAIEGCKVSFYMNPQVGMIELIDRTTCS